MDVERTMEFIQDQEARSLVWVNETRTLVRRTAGQQRDLTQAVRAMREEYSGVFRAVVGNQKELAECRKQLWASHREMADKLNALIDIVDGMIRRPHKPPEFPTS